MPNPSRPKASSQTPLKIHNNKQHKKASSSSQQVFYWGFVVFLATALNVAIHLIGRVHDATVCNNTNGRSGAVVDHLESFLDNTAASLSTSNSNNIRMGSKSQQPQSSSISTTENDLCQVEFQRVTSNQTKGLTPENLRRSWTHVGSRKRLAKLAHKLQQRKEPVNAVVSGGSISLGHGVIRGLRYSDRLATWMNDKYPLQKQQEHQVLNKGSHGADVRKMCWIIMPIMTTIDSHSYTSPVQYLNRFVPWPSD